MHNILLLDNKDLILEMLDLPWWSIRRLESEIEFDSRAEHITLEGGV